MVGSEFTGNVNDIPPLTDDYIIAALPTQWSNVGTIRASIESLPAGGAWDAEQYWTFYATGSSGAIEVVGYATTQANLDSNFEIAERQIQFLDSDEITVIGGATDNESFATTYYYSPGSKLGDYTYTYISAELQNEIIVNQTKTVDN